MRSNPGQHQMGRMNHRGTPCPPGPPPQPLGLVKAETGSANDNITACAMAPPPHHLEVDQQSGSNGSSSGGNVTREQDLISDQELIDMLEATDTSRTQEGNVPATIEDSSVVNAEEELISGEVLQQTVAAGVDQGCQPFMEFLKDWAKQFRQHQLVAKVAELEGELKRANQQNQELGGEYRKLRARYNTANTKLGEANMKLGKALRERDEHRRLAEGSALANSAKATDDVVLEKWKILNYNIRVLAHSLAKSPPSLSLDDVAEDRLRWISPLFRKHLQDDDYREFVLQGYLWVMVHDMVFDSETQVWGGPGLVDLKILRDNLIDRIGQEDSQEQPPACQQAARWFAQGSSMLNRFWGSDMKCVRSLTNTETKRLRPFFSSPSASFDRTDKRVWDEIKAIIKCAVELDQIFMCSKAIFQIHWRDDSQKPSMRQRFNSDIMHAVCYEKDLSPKSMVQFFISPFLYKAGNADGQNYECRMLLTKGSVVCD
ncbi:hypothetical protein BHE90_014612 [Fusarium euwallaceae]|uniref:Uncharacterized protein n=1 Tax=Fusarium euwallaceae TaxID=1147111 RepID=A0A430L5H4_9HYPO|nr:hypothetical protein BHE90_014612 [Fusarium euwallaceae]